jgi:Tfp pilus assembly PilM family ATPase
MPEKILGLDIGGDSVKAVLLSRGFRGKYRALAVRLVELAAAGGLPEALEQLFAEESFRGALCVTALPAGLLSYRNLRLPFRDEKRIRQTLAFALEPQLPMSLEEVFVDHSATARGNESEIFAALAGRALIAERTALLAPYVREVAVIDIDAVPLACRLMLTPGFPESALVLDIGARDTTAVFVRANRIVQIRHFPFGGESLTTALAEALGIGIPEAEARKRDGQIPPEAAESLAALCRGFGTELRNTQTSLIWQGVIDQAPARIYLTGGGSQLDGLAEILIEDMGVPVERTDLAEWEAIEFGESFCSDWDPALMDQALALAARPMGKGNGFNFRQRAFEAGAGYGELRALLRKGAIAALVILALAAVEIGLDDYGARLRLEALKKEIATEFRKIDPETTRIVDPLAQLRGRIGEARKRSAGVGDAVPATVLDLLKEISGLAPPDLLLTAFNLDGDVISIKGEAKNFDAVDALKKAFTNSSHFKAVTIGTTNMLKQGTGVEFDLKIALKK